ncbi:MAG: MFS transporter [Chloroflexi bacterium]|nr:MFS transporter [Chloroflexota bacterium]
MMGQPGGPAGLRGAPREAGVRLLFNLRTFESLKIRNFRFYLISSIAQMTPMNMQMTASGWFMYKLTGSVALLGVAMLVSAVPQLALSFVGGVFADRVSRKAILIAGQLATMVLMLWVGLFAHLGIITWYHLLINAFLQGAIMALMMPARQSIIPSLVGRDNIMNAVGLNMAGMNLNRLGAPALAGFLIAAFGIHYVYYLMGILYFVAALLILPLRLQAPEVPNGGMGGMVKRSVIGDVVLGLAYARDNKDVRAILILTLLTIFFSMAYFVVLPVFTEDILKVGPQGLGLLISGSGVGALIGSLVIASMPNRGRGLLFLHAAAVTGVGLFFFAWSTHYYLSMVILAFVGLGQAWRMSLSNVLLQAYTEDAYLGRVMSLMMMEWGLTSLGGAAVPIIGEFIGIQLAVALSAVFLVLVALFYYAFSPRIRRMA